MIVSDWVVCAFPRHIARREVRSFPSQGPDVRIARDRDTNTVDTVGYTQALLQEIQPLVPRLQSGGAKSEASEAANTPNAAFCHTSHI